ncbi:hypothetical protein AVEN_185290-1 [Araneus ventricosus]|uniref:Uncharacterized protein n=1 Tax=Araneus ventricosus TaxID=182803 RepID=A0A4Y2PVD7_ARAVE|nr:hypothetical protein AVEN_185290-1 [Araneus ventricosus]
MSSPTLIQEPELILAQTLRVGTGHCNNHLLHRNVWALGRGAVLPELLQDVPIAIRNRMLFQHDGAPAHFVFPLISYFLCLRLSTDVHNYLNATFGARWFGRGRPVP